MSLVYLKASCIYTYAESESKLPPYSIQNINQLGYCHVWWFL